MRFSCGKIREKGRGWGGWGRDRQRNRQVNAQASSKLPFSKLPFIRKVWASLKFVSAKFGFTPTPRKGPKLRKNCTNQYKILKIDTFSGGGGRNFMEDFMDIWAFLTLVSPLKQRHGNSPTVLAFFNAKSVGKSP